MGNHRLKCRNGAWSGHFPVCTGQSHDYIAYYEIAQVHIVYLTFHIAYFILHIGHWPMVSAVVMILQIYGKTNYQINNFTCFQLLGNATQLYCQNWTMERCFCVLVVFGCFGAFACFGVFFCVLVRPLLIRCLLEYLSKIWLFNRVFLFCYCELWCDV